MKGKDLGMLEAFHSNWTAPFLVLNQNTNYFIEDFEILTTILSALKWREFNGSIKMITDERAADYYKKIGIESIWDLGIDVKLHSEVHKDIDSNLFWAAGKIYSLKDTKAPIVMMDTDFIVWETIEDKIKGNDICVIHKEPLSDNVYPNKGYFDSLGEYKLNDNWDWEEKPCNTALTYIGDEDFKNYYVEEAINFMRQKWVSRDRIINMVFAEQRLIAMCAKEKNLRIKELATIEELFNKDQESFTHVWGFKDIMRNNFKLRNEFCIKCIARIIKDYPEYEEVLANIYQLAYHYNCYKELSLKEKKIFIRA